MKNRNLKNELNTRIVLIICLFSLVVFALIYFGMSSLVKNTIEKNVENSIDFAKKFCNQKNQILNILTEGSINKNEFYKMARHQVTEVMDMLRFGKEGFIWFADENAIVRIHPNDNFIDQPIQKKELSLFLENFHKNGKIESVRFNDNIYFVSYYDKWKLFIIIEANYNDLFQLVFILSYIFVFIFIAFIIAIFILTRIMAKKIVKPIESLSQISTEILNGAHAESFQWHIEGCQEIRNLGSALKTLIENLFLKNQEMIEKNAMLQESYQEEQAAKEEMEAAYEELEAAYEEMETTHRELEAVNNRLDDALEKANEANRLKEELLALMSHEIRTPLTGILGFTNLIIKEISEENHVNPHLQYLEYISKSASRLNDLLSNLLELSSEMAGKKIEIKNETFNLENTLNDIIILLNKSILENTNEISYKINCDSFIYSDPLRLQQILYNIIGNAMKFTTKGQIKINVTKEQDHYLFSIQDSGIGIEKSQQDKIFDIFQQIDSSKTRKYQGAGIGLSVCKRFVDVLGGIIWVESELGKGSVFYFKIPIPAEKNVEKQSERKFFYDGEIKNLKILFAEDDITNHVLIKRIIQTLNPIKLKGAFKGTELLKEFKFDQDYDIVLMDIQMPEMNGIDCLAEIRKINSKIPVIALTAYSMKDDKQKLINLGFNEYLEKPFDAEILKEKISQIIM